MEASDASHAVWSKVGTAECASKVASKVAAVVAAAVAAVVAADGPTDP